MYKKGFTLIELMTAISIFAVVMTISMGSIIGIFDANRKSESMKTVMDNLNFALETMSREIRFGTNYHCGSSGTLTSPQNCSTANSTFVFRGQDSKTYAYTFNNGTPIQKSTDGAVTFIDVTAPEVTITALNFIVAGAQSSDGQPRVLIQIKGYAGAKLSSRSSFTLETLVTQRARDTS